MVKKLLGNVVSSPVGDRLADAVTVTAVAATVAPFGVSLDEWQHIAAIFGGLCAAVYYLVSAWVKYRNRNR